jgi:hypothetical protein
MKTRLKGEQLETRDCPATGSKLVPIGVGVDYTLSLNTYGRLATMQLAAPDWLAWANGAVTQAQVEAMTQRIYQYFPDQFDQIVFVNNLPDVSPSSPYFGVHFPVKNETLGIGQTPFDDTALFGSKGHLQAVIHLASEKDLYQRTSLHEFVHLDANFLPELQSAVPAHWGFSSVGGQLGGWAPGTLRQIGPNTYDADGPNGRPYFFPGFADVEDGDVAYAQLELYLLGLIDATQLDPIQYATNAQFTNPSLGQFTASSIQTVTWQNIVSQEGLRIPTPATSQKNFRVLTVVMTPNPLTQTQLDKFDTDVELFGKPGPDGDPKIKNFWMATGGRATLTMDGLDAFIPARDPMLGVGTQGGMLLGIPTTSGGLYDTSRAVRPDLSAFLAGDFSTDIRVAVGDVNGDTIPDYAIASGPGGITKFAVVSGDLSHYVIPPTLPFSGSEDFTGGAFVSVGDLDGDGRAEVVVSPDESGGPRVVVFSFKPSTGVYVEASFLGINDPNFRGGARTAVGDVNNDSKPDLAVAAGFGGGPRVSLFDGATLFTTRGHIAPDFFAFSGADISGLRNGVYAALGDVNGDGFADLVIGGGPGGAPRVSVLSGAKLSGGLSGVAAAVTAPLANFFVANDSSDRGGVRVAVKNADGDRMMEIVAGSGEGSTSRIRVYRGSAVTNSGEPKSFQDIDPFGGVLADGVFVG